ncbi:MAG: hypothetical protein JWQ65_818 [Devosia sp.]|nr:hypothetical protein [Devosia sp.]
MATETAIDPVREDDFDQLPLTWLHLLVVFACAFGFCFDLAEIAFANILSAIFSAPPNKVDGQTLAWLLAAVYVGAIAGAPLGGWLADRYGRRFTMILTLLLLALTSTAAAFSPGMLFLIVARGLSGLALGAYPPLMTAYLADILPPARRGPLVMVAIAIGYIGPPAMIFMVRWLTPIAPFGLDAWRWAFLVGGVGAALCALLFWAVPESGRWLIGKGNVIGARKTLSAYQRSRTALPFLAPTAAQAIDSGKLAPQTFRRRVGFLMVSYFLTPWATVGFTLLAGAVLIQKGIKVQDSLLYVGISNFGPIFGTILGSFLIDRVNRKVALVILAGLLAVVGLAFGAVTDAAPLMTTGLIFNLLTSAFLPVLVLYAAELFPTAQRGLATSLAWTSNRVGSAIVPLALLPLLQTAGPVPMFAVIAITLAGFMTVVWVFGPKTSR